MTAMEQGMSSAAPKIDFAGVSKTFSVRGQEVQALQPGARLDLVGGVAEQHVAEAVAHRIAGLARAGWAGGFGGSPPIVTGAAARGFSSSGSRSVASSAPS